MKKRMFVLLFGMVLALGMASSATMEMNGGALLAFHGDTAIGANMDVTYMPTEHFGVKIETNYIASDVSFDGDVVTLKNAFTVSTPVLFWMEYPVGNLSLGGGAGVAAVFSDSFDVCLAGALDVTYRFSDSWGCVIGVTGNLDCIPTLENIDNGDSTSFFLEASDFAKNHVVAKLGASYRMGL